jgi:hypothetical protein
MVSQQLRVYAPHVAQRCLELGRRNPDYNIGIQKGWIFPPIGYPALLLCITQFKRLYNKQSGQMRNGQLKGTVKKAGCQFKARCK